MDQYAWAVREYLAEFLFSHPLVVSAKVGSDYQDQSYIDFSQAIDVKLITGSRHMVLPVIERPGTVWQRYTIRIYKVVAPGIFAADWTIPVPLDEPDFGGLTDSLIAVLRPEAYGMHQVG